MLRLSREGYEKAEEFIMQKGRELEKALFKYYFKDGSLEEALSQLAKYENEDGGFGHCLESDVRLEASNPFSTSVAFQILCDLKADSSNSLVKGGIEYLVKNYKPKFKGWLLFPPEVDMVPRAVWWNYEPNADNKYNCNPSAEIAGYLARFRELVPEHMVSEAVAAALEYLEVNSENLSMHDIFCYQRMAKSLPEEKRKLVMDKLRKRVPEVIEFEKAKWTGYEARPLSFIHTPQGELMDVVDSEILNINLDYLIKEQKEEGCWTPTWNWHRFEGEWKKARQEWEGHITLESLKILKAFGRIEADM